MLTQVGLFLLVTLGLPGARAVAESDLLEAIPADAVAVVAFDARPDSPGVGLVYGGRNAHSFEVLKAWLKAGVHQGLIELSRELDVEKHLTSWLEGRGAVAYLQDGGEGERVRYYLALVKDGESARTSLVRMGRAAEKNEWAKFFSKEGTGSTLYHLIVKPRAESEGEPVHVCFCILEGMLLATEEMAPLERWLARTADTPSFAATSPGEALRSSSEAVVQFFVRMSAFQPADLSELPLPVPLPEPGDRPSVRAQGPFLAHAVPPADNGDEQGAETEASPSTGLRAFDSVYGSLAFRETGMQYDWVATFRDDLSDETKQFFARRAEARVPAKELLAAAPPDTVVAAQMSSPDDLFAMFGLDLAVPQDWVTLFGGDREEEGAVSAVPDSVQRLLQGDLLLCLPSLGRVTPAEEEVPGFNPLDFLPFTAVIRPVDGTAVDMAFAALRTWLEETSPLRFNALKSGAVWAIVRQDADEPKPLAFAALKGDYLLFSRSVSEVGRASRRLDGADRSLGDHPCFQEVYAALGADAPVLVYINPVEFVARGGEVGLSEVKRPNPYLRKALELTLEGMRGFGTTFRVVDNAVQTKMFLGVDYERISETAGVQMLAMLAAVGMSVGFTQTTVGEEVEEMDAELAEALAADFECVENLGAIAEAILVFARKSGRYPDANRWTQDIMPYLKSTARLHCPEDDEDHPCSYGFNKKLHRLPVAQVRNPAGTILVFDCNGSSANPHGLGDVLALRHAGEAYIAYCDRHLEVADQAPVTGWDPAERRR